jgi:hypothetical protein
MPKPLFIICSESGVEDKDSRMISLYNILEKVEATRSSASGSRGPAICRPMPFRITAVWMRTEEDGHDDLEAQIAMFLPADGQEVTGERVRFRYEPGKPLHRLVVFTNSDWFNGPGVFRAVSRIRKVGSTEWITQEYPVTIEEVRPPEQVGTEEGMPAQQPQQSTLQT